MTHFLIFLSIFAIVALQLNAQKISKPETFLLPITKHEPTKQFYTTFNIGSSPKSPINFVLDLETDLSWLNCRKIKSLSSLRLVTCKSSTCKSINGTSCNGSSCLYKETNPFGLKPEITGRVVQDKISIPAIPGGKLFSFPSFTFLCTGQKNLQGLAPPAAGVFGLVPSATSLMRHVSSKMNIMPQISLCLPSGASTGKLFIGGMYQVSDVDFRGSRTPLRGRNVGDYVISVLSIYVGGTKLPLKDGLLDGGAKLSTVVPYGLLQTDIYNALVNSFTLNAKVMGISKVSPVAPFKNCFDTRTAGTNVTGPIVPVIELGVVGNMQEPKWAFYGANTMVKVSETVMCLAFIDSGKKPKDLIVLGSYQLQDYLLEFDFSRTFLGFSESLLLHNSSCSSWLTKK